MNDKLMVIVLFSQLFGEFEMFINLKDLSGN